MSYIKSLSSFTSFRLLRRHSVSMHLVPLQYFKYDEDMSAERHIDGSKLSCLTGKHIRKINQYYLIYILLLTCCIFWNGAPRLVNINHN